MALGLVLDVAVELEGEADAHLRSDMHGHEAVVEDEVHPVSRVARDAGTSPDRRKHRRRGTNVRCEQQLDVCHRDRDFDRVVVLVVSVHVDGLADLG